jgi:hypothetical protein
MELPLVAIAVCAAALAQDKAKLLDALEWTAAQRGRMAEMTNRVVRVHGTASLAGLICPDDPVTASGLYRDAIASLHTLPDSIFKDKGTTVLPAASFTGLWKFVVPAAVKCDPGLTSLANNERSRERIDAERNGANATLQRALNLIDPNSPLDKYDQIDRAAQLGHAALDAADPDSFDFDLFTQLLLQLRDRGPDLATDLLTRALDLVNTAPVPRAESLQELALYALTSPKLAEAQDYSRDHDTITVSGVTIEKLTATRLSANPDDISLMIEAAVKLLKSDLAISHNPVVSWALGWQLLQQARELEPSRVTELENTLTSVQSSYSVPAGDIQNQLGSSENPNPEGGDTAHRNYWLVGQIQGALGADRIDQARSLLPEVTDLPARGQLTTIVGFRDAAIATPKRLNEALPLANLVPGGIKRALLYIGMVATAKDRDTALQMAALAVRDIAPLPAEQRVRLSSTLTAALLGINVDAAITNLSDVVHASNDAYVSPRRGRFDPGSVRRTYNPDRTSFSDSMLILPSARGFTEAVETVRGRHNFTLRAPIPAVFSIADLISAATVVEPGRLESAILELRDENTRASALARLADLKLKLAKTAAAPK